MLNQADVERGSVSGAIVNGHRNNQYHQKTRLHGDYLRAQDPGMFEANYQEYLHHSQHQHLAQYE